MLCAPSFSSMGCKEDALIIERRWSYYLALANAMVSLDGSVTFAMLDGDCLRAVGAALPLMVAHNVASRDHRPAGLVALSSTSKCARDALSTLLTAARAQHEARLLELSSACNRLGASWDALLRARDLFALPGGAECSGCGTWCEHSGGIFSAGPLAPDDVTAAFCAHCFRGLCDLSMRPGATGVEQTWEEPIEDGTWQLVQDYSNAALDSPLLSREEYSEEWPEAAPGLVARLNMAGYVLIGDTSWAAVDVNSAPALSPLQGILLADLIGSGYGSHLLSLNLARCGLNDAGLAQLANALVGNALFLRYLSLSGNPIGDDGLSAFGGTLTPRRYELMLPCLQWLHLVLEECGDLGASAIARALQDQSLPSLEVLWMCGRFSEVPGEGFHELTRACDERYPLLLEMDHGVAWGV